MRWITFSISELLKGSLINTMDNLSDLNEAFSAKSLPNTVLVLFFLIVGIFGNSLVIYVYEFRFPRSEGRCFIGPLAVSDLGTIISTSVLNLLQNLMKFTFPGQIVCKCVYFLSNAFINTSFFLWTVIAIQRYRKICKPFEWQMKRDWRKWCILILAGFSFAFFLPVFYFYGVNEKVITENNITVYVCEQTKTNARGLVIYQGVGLLMSLLNVIAIISIYIIVFINIYKTMKGVRRARGAEMNESATSSTLPVTFISTIENPTNELSRDQHTNTSSSVRTEAQKVEHTIAFTFMTIVLLGLISYAPSRSLLVYESINPKFWENLNYSTFNLYLFLRRSYVVIHSCNVFIYLIFDTLFRNQIKNWIEDEHV